MRTLAFPTLFAAGVLTAGCERSAHSERDFVVRDSAGVTIVENRRPQPDMRLGWEIGSVPSLSIGGAVDDPGHDLFNVTDAIQLGVTSVREVVQAKRHKGTIQRKELDALRGSLYQFNAIRGTIVATSRFAKGALEAAFALGQPPITLIDGDRLIDLLIEHGIGVRTRAIKVLAFDPEGLSPHED